MTFQVAKVNKALGSVHRMVKAGNRVVFELEGSYVQNTTTENKLWLEETDGVYVLPLVVAPPPSELRKQIDKHKSSQGFPWQGR